MNADAIIFDKDGTLLDFDAFWGCVTRQAMERLLSDLSAKDVPMEEILEAFGVHDGVTDIDGVLCKGTYAEMGEITYEILHAHGCKVSLEEVQRRIVDVYNESIGAGEIKPTDPNLSKVLAELKARGKKLALVTTDNEVITGKCLSALGVCGLFDKIYTDDGKTPKKPDPFCAKDFCERMGVDASRVVMVGDTATDVRFARNAGISVIILAKDEKSKGCLSSQADAVIERISSLLQVVS